jgi:hypothetical protein
LFSDLFLPGSLSTVILIEEMETFMTKIKLACIALIMLGMVPASSVWAGRGHGHGHNHHGHHRHHHNHGGGHGGYGLAIGMGLLGYGLGYLSNRAPSYPPQYGYPSAGYAPGYGYAPVIVPPAPPVYIQQGWR